MYGIDSYTKLMLHFNGADGSTTFTDSSGSPHTFTVTGDAQIDTAQSKFGGASGLFDGTGDFIDTPDSDDWNVAAGNFTIDLWVRRNATGSTQAIAAILDTTATATGSAFVLYFDSADKINFGISNGTAFKVAKTTSAYASTSVWYHIAGVRDGNTLRIFVDGVADGTFDVTGATVPNSTRKLVIGRYGEYAASPFYWNGWIDEFRFSKGIARWTTNFTPPNAAYTTILPEILTRPQIDFESLEKQFHLDSLLYLPFVDAPPAPETITIDKWYMLPVVPDFFVEPFLELDKIFDYPSQEGSPSPETITVDKWYAAPVLPTFPFDTFMELHASLVIPAAFIVPADFTYTGTTTITLSPTSEYSATFGYTGSLTMSLVPGSDYDGKFNYTGTATITITSPDTGIVVFTTDIPYFVQASVFIGGVDYTYNIFDTVNVSRGDNAAATFTVTINSSAKPSSFINQVVSIAFQAADENGVVADYVPIFKGIVKRVVFNESDKAYTLSGYDYGGVHQIPGEFISENITEVLSGSVWISASGTKSTGFAPIWGVTYSGTADIVDGRDYFVDTLNGEILVPVSSNFINNPGGLSFKYAKPFATLKAMLQYIAALKSWTLNDTALTLADYSVPAKQPVLSVSDESVIDIIRKFLELSGGKCETNLYPSMRLYSELTNITGVDNHVIDESVYYEDSLSFSVSFEDLLNEQTVRSVGKTFANIEIGAGETIADESGSVTTELLYDVMGYVDVVIPALQPRLIAEVRITKANINSIGHTAGGTFVHLFGSATAIQNSDWIQSEEGNEIVFRLQARPDVDAFTVRTIVSYPGADWTLLITGTKIEYGEGTIEQTVEVTSTRAVTGVTETLAGDVYENPYLETAAHAENCANAILCEHGNVYEMACEVPLHKAAAYEIGDKVNVERNSSVIFIGIIKSLNYQIDTGSANSPVGVTAKGVGFDI